MLDEPRLVRTVTHIGELFVRGDFEAVESLTGGRRLSAGELREAVRSYGRTLTLPPGDRFLPRSVVEIEGEPPERWNVYVDLWTKEEGRSDLTLEATVSDSTKDLYDVEIENLHVL